MTRFHLTPEGEPGICKARTKCPYGDMDKDHYGSKEEARQAYEAFMTDVEETIEAARKNKQELTEAKGLPTAAEVIAADYGQAPDGRWTAKLEDGREYPLARDGVNLVRTDGAKLIALVGSHPESQSGASGFTLLTAKTASDKTWKRLGDTEYLDENGEIVYPEQIQEWGLVDNDPDSPARIELALNETRREASILVDKEESIKRSILSEIDDEDFDSYHVGRTGKIIREVANIAPDGQILNPQEAIVPVCEVSGANKNGDRFFRITIHPETDAGHPSYVTVRGDMESRRAKKALEAAEKLKDSDIADFTKTSLARERTSNKHRSLLHQYKDKTGIWL